MSHCRGAAPVSEVPEAGRRIVLAGNPNVGKSAIFHGLTGIYAEVSNFPGTTVDMSIGRLGRDTVYDTPGVYGISGFTDEERVAKQIILQADVVVNVVAAAHLDRDLFLTLQIIEMGFPTVVALNMVDEAQEAGLVVDASELAGALGVEVVPTIATRGTGVDELRRAIERARPGCCSGALASYLPAIPNQADALLVAEDDPDTCARHGLQTPGTREVVYRLRRERADEIARSVIQETTRGISLATRLGRWAIHPIIGPALLALLLTAAYYLLGVFVAQTVVGITEGIWMGEYYVPWIGAWVSRVVDPGGLVGQLLIGEFGLLTMTASYLVGLLLPLVVGFYFVLSFMEDSGYLPRVAVLVDRLMVRVGLNGRAIIPMVLGFGCVTMATITTRMMGTQRERTIATFLLSLAIPCSAQLAVITAMLAPLGAGYLLLFGTILLLVYGAAGVAVDRLLPGQSSDLLLDLPPLRWPSLANMSRKTYLKSKGFLGEAGLFFAVGSLVVSMMHISGVLNWLQGLLEPVTVRWLGLPRETANAFIMGFVRRDFGAAGLFDLTLTPHQTMVSMVTITLFVPCIAAIMIMLKERGKREGVLIWAADLVLAVFVGGLVHRALFWQ